MHPVSCKVRRIVAQLIAFAFLIAPLAPSTAQHGHAGHDFDFNKVVGSAPSHHGVSGGDSPNVSQCGFLACEVFTPVRNVVIAARPPSQFRSVMRHDPAPYKHWVWIDPPVPR